MLDHYAMMDKLDELLAKDEVPADTKVLIQAFRQHADRVETRLKDLEKLTHKMKTQAMFN